MTSSPLSYFADSMSKPKVENLGLLQAVGHSLLVDRETSKNFGDCVRLE